MSSQERKYTGAGFAKAVGAYLPRIAKEAFQKHGFPSSQILAEWPAIIGTDLASFTAPERIIWPKRPSHQSDEGQTTAYNSRRRPHGATLVLRVEGPRALEIQHATRQIIDQVNSVFGYRAIANIRIQQGPVARESKAAKPEKTKESTPDESGLERIENDSLRFALARLGEHIPNG